MQGFPDFFIRKYKHKCHFAINFKIIRAKSKKNTYQTTPILYKVSMSRDFYTKIWKFYAWKLKNCRTFAMSIDRHEPYEEGSEYNN